MEVQAKLTTVPFIFSVTTVVLTIAAKDARDAAIGVGTFELAG